jgi:multisubunit Na+/H+ antiporter MnhB subunit
VLAFPFLVAAIGFNCFLTGLEPLRRWARPIQKIAGILLVVIGLLFLTGRFAAVSASLADLGQWIDLEL